MLFKKSEHSIPIRVGGVEDGLRMGRVGEGDQFGFCGVGVREPSGHLTGNVYVLLAVDQEDGEIGLLDAIHRIHRTVVKFCQRSAPIIHKINDGKGRDFMLTAQCAPNDIPRRGKAAVGKDRADGGGKIDI